MNMVQFISELLSLTRHGEQMVIVYSALFFTPHASENARFVAGNLTIGMCPLPAERGKVGMVVEPLTTGDHIHVMIEYEVKAGAFERIAQIYNGEIILKGQK